jgi:competence protein ComEC
MTSEGRFCAHFLNEGDGDSIVLQFPDNSLAVVDCCNSVKTHRYLKALGRQLELGKPQLVFVAVTHAHADHDNIRPLIDKLGGRDFVEEVWLSSWPVPRQEKLIDYCSVEGISLLPLDGDRDRLVCEYGGVKVEVLSPGPLPSLEEIVTEVKKGAHNWVNDSSLVLRFDWQSHILLLTGDAGTSNWSYVNNKATYEWGKKYLRQTQVLKVPHHGSRYNIDSGILREIQPEVAIVSAARRGEGRFKTLPDEKVEQTLADEVDHTYYTYNGSCAITPDGRTWRVEPLDDSSMYTIPKPPTW